MITLSDLAIDNKEFDFVLKNGKKLHIEYNPNNITPKMMELAIKGSDELAETLSTLIKAWDLVDADKKPIEPTKEFFLSLRIELLNDIFGGIISDAFPKATQ
jgi:hypothetical protein